jgi:peptidoglycan hydrolase-like protein with peptidoglycan-binding domain
VQLGLLAYGYYEGTIDGVVGPKMKDSIRRFQKDFGLNVTGTITPQVLDTLKITAE